MPSYASKSDLPADLRRTMTALLNRQLADAIDLGLQLKHAHWNVKGPQFIALHELFDKIAEQVAEYADSLAERAVQLGGMAQGTLQAIAPTTRLPAYPGTVLMGDAHLAALANALGSFGASSRRAIGEAADDADTADLFTEVSRGTDKLLWLLEAHLHVESR